MANKKNLHIKSWLTPPSTELSDFLAGDNQLVICNGVNPCFQLGQLRKDLGYTALHVSVGSKQVRSLFDFRQSSSVQKVLFTLNSSDNLNTELWYWSGSDMYQITTAAWATYNGQAVNMAPFLGYCFFVGSDASGNFLPVASLTGTTFSTSTNVTSMAQGKFITRYRDRLYVANCKAGGSTYPYRVYFSSVPTAGAITWTQATDFFDVDFSEEITGMGVAFDRLVIFTEYNAYVYDQLSRLQQNWPGCVNNKSIQSSESYLFYANTDGVWCSTGGRPQCISTDINQLIRNSTKSRWSSALVDRTYTLFLGDTSANGVSYDNLSVNYDIPTGMWWWREYRGTNNTNLLLCNVKRSGNDYLYLADGNGVVHVKSKYGDTSPVYTDNSVAISAWFRTKAFDFGDPSVEKRITKILAYAIDGSNIELRFRVLDKNQEALMPFKPIGTVKEMVNIFDRQINGNFIQIEGKEYSKNKYFKFLGLSLILAQETTQD